MSDDSELPRTLSYRLLKVGLMLERMAVTETGHEQLDNEILRVLVDIGNLEDVGQDPPLTLVEKAEHLADTWLIASPNLNESVHSDFMRRREELMKRKP